MSEWADYFQLVFDMEDRNKRAQQDVERVNRMINALQKSRIPLEKKRYKGAVLKEIRRGINPHLESFYSFNAIRYAINNVRYELIAMGRIE